MSDIEAETRVALDAIRQQVVDGGSQREVMLMDIIDMQQAMIDRAERRVAEYARFYNWLARCAVNLAPAHKEGTA